MYWQVGYQRSGNKWLCYLIANALTHRAPSTRAEYQALIPNHVDARSGKSIPRLGWVRSHLTADAALASGVPVQGAIAVVRHPLDVLVSSFAYRTIVDARIDVSRWTYDQYRSYVRSYAEQFIEMRGEPAFNGINAGNWCAVTRSWLDESRRNPNVEVVTYEELRESTARVLEGLLADVTDTRIPRAKIDAAVLAARQGRTDRLSSDGDVGTPETPAVSALADMGFAMRGASGAWRDLLSDEQVARAAEVFGEVSERLGYEFK